MSHLLDIVLMGIKLLYRNREAVFFTFLFPIFILLLFGTAWRQVPNYTSFLTPGVIGLVVLSNSFYAVGVALVSSRYYGILKRFMVTPLPRSVFLGGYMLSQFLIIIAQSVLLVLFAIFFYRLTWAGNPLSFLFVLMIGTLAFMSIGMVIASLASTPEGANGLVNMALLPMLFLSGTFFSISFFPSAVQWVAKLLPLTHLLDALRSIFIDGRGLAENWQSLAVLLGWFIICFTISVKSFKWV